ncbi:uncharacterized protein LOC117711622 isoform X3 [Arvicanthis niloticus]|uniref:uncharacterized protein LOC117711622 isoform X3 n=1 Tax=Arvicanthis niloticus TaxID=61156 RepID=UPI001485D11C|nr:uncharacterized protein LOC117711622 isoform X5 [Arvicanthis niloticus]
MPLPLVGGTIWTGMGPQEEARTGFQQWNLGTHSLSVVEIMHGVMKICLVERTESWTSLHGSWSMNINHCCRQACLCQHPGSCSNPGVCQEK